jgi:signal transduction histidine kinase
VAVFTIASLLTVWMKAADTMDAQGRALKDQNERLEAANALITEQNDELERRRREAEDASGRKSRLLRSVSHDMRSPINAITMMAEVIRRRAGDPALATDVPGLAQRLQSNAASLNELVTNVLDVSALETGRIAFHASEFSLNELLSEVGAQLLNVAQAKRLKLTVQVPEATIRLRVDRTALMRVITNLLTNAIKFTDRGDVVVVAELMPDRAVEIRVQDTGVGIAADDLKHLFEDFARFEGAGALQGWGLGLAICRRLVEMIGGTITAASESNVGSVFTVTLPATCVLDREPRVAGGPAA